MIFRSQEKRYRVHEDLVVEKVFECMLKVFGVLEVLQGVWCMPEQT